MGFMPPLSELLPLAEAVEYARQRGHSYPRMSLNHDIWRRLKPNEDVWMIGNRWFISKEALERRIRERCTARPSRPARAGRLYIR